MNTSKSIRIATAPPSKEEIANAFGRYKLAVKVLGQMVDAAEEMNRDDNRWFIFAEKIARKFLTQAYTLESLLSNDLYLISKGQETRFVDFSSLVTLLRTQFEAHAVFYHLFGDKKCGMEEKIIRFRLWELDGLKTRQGYARPLGTKVDLAGELKEMEKIKRIINGFYFFQKLDKSRQDFLMNKAAWRFTVSSLSSNDKSKWRLSIEQMIKNTGLKDSHFQDWYSFASVHAHTCYWSVVQSDTLTEAEKIIGEYVIIMQASFVSSFFIKDFCGIYTFAKDIFDALPVLEQDVINSLNQGGRA